MNRASPLPAQRAAEKLIREQTDGSIVNGWSTKYALSSGICAVRGEKIRSYVYVGGDSLNLRLQLKIGRTFFESLDEAKTSVRAAASRKITSLKKQILKLEQLATEPQVER